MCAAPETTSVRTAGSALRRVGVALVATVVVAGSPAPAGAEPAPRAAAAPRPALAPAPAPPPPAAAPPAPYTVRSGDSLSKIAAQHRLDPRSGWREIYDANPVIVNPNVLHVGWLLGVPSPGQQVADRPLPSAPAVSPASAPSRSGGTGTWDQLAQCESGGDWRSTRGAYDGGLQFHPSTWRSAGGGQYASTAAQATREQQIAVAERVRANQGWDAWPSCARQLGLR